MDNEKSLSELTESYEEQFFKNSDLLVLLDILAVNHKPHPFMIGSKHVKDAADNHCGMLGKETLDKIGCAMQECTLSYAEHTYDTVMFIKLKRDASTEEVSQFLSLLEESMKKDKIDGFTFVETPEKFRIA